LIASLTGNAEALKENNARVLVIAPEHTDSIRALAPLAALVVAMDSPGQLHCTLGATDAAGNLLPTIYITDRFGEVFAALQSPEVAALPDAQELIRWLEFINQQCEECSPPEWPE
jgi:hypothetical protein